MTVAIDRVRRAKAAVPEHDPAGPRNGRHRAGGRIGSREQPDAAREPGREGLVELGRASLGKGEQDRSRHLEPALGDQCFPFQTGERETHLRAVVHAARSAPPADLLAIEEVTHDLQRRFLIGLAPRHRLRNEIGWNTIFGERRRTIAKEGVDHLELAGLHAFEAHVDVIALFRPLQEVVHGCGIAEHPALPLGIVREAHLGGLLLGGLRRRRPWHRGSEGRGRRGLNGPVARRPAGRTRWKQARGSKGSENGRFHHIPVTCRRLLLPELRPAGRSLAGSESSCAASAAWVG